MADKTLKHVKNQRFFTVAKLCFANTVKIIKNRRFLGDKKCIAFLIFSILTWRIGAGEKCKAFFYASKIEDFRMIRTPKVFGALECGAFGASKIFDFRKHAKSLILRFRKTSQKFSEFLEPSKTCFRGRETKFLMHETFGFVSFCFPSTCENFQFSQLQNQRFCKRQKSLKNSLNFWGMRKFLIFAVAKHSMRNSVSLH